MTRRHPRMCLLGFGWPPTILRGSKPPKKTKMGAWLGIFQPKWQNHKIVIYPAGNIGSIPNFDTIIEPHSWLRGWSRITKFYKQVSISFLLSLVPIVSYITMVTVYLNYCTWHNKCFLIDWFKMADGRHIAEYWKRYNSPINGPIWMKLGWSHHMMSPICPPCCGCHGNSRCLATAHCTFNSYGRLEAERVNQIWWNLVHNSKLGP